MIELVIPEATPSLNKLLRMHWAKRKRLQRDWGWMIAAQMLRRAPVGNGPLQRAHITVTRRGVKLLDPDNAVASCKLLLDCLVSQGYIADDSPEHITLTVEQVRGKPQTTIQIREVA